MERRRILIGVSGGIAAYKAPELARVFVRSGHDVRCVLTPAASEFVAPLSLQTVTGAPARTELFDATEEGQIDHIALADWADVFVVAPATADVIARLAHGLANDLLTTVALATRARILLAPAMNIHMWHHAATQENLRILRERGADVVGPNVGALACGWEGEGRMSDPEQIAAAAERLLTPNDLSGVQFLVTAGGTQEPLDAVRFIGNRSSGKMGFALAEQAALRGASVTLVSGPTPLPTPLGVTRIAVTTALEMRDAVLEALPKADVVIKAAAVADFRAADPVAGKLKKESLDASRQFNVSLVPNPDILAEISAQKGDRIVVGFAAESGDLLGAAKRKIARKGCDLLVANDVSQPDCGFDVDTNTVSFVWPSGEVESLPPLSKREVALRILDRARALREERA